MNQKHLTKAATAGILSLVPGVSALQTAWDTYFQSQSEERRKQIDEEFIQRLNSANEGTKEAFKRINENPANFAIFLNTIKGAGEDIEKEKIRLYINSLINAIQTESIDNTLTHIFLNVLRKYSILHIKLLKYFNASHDRCAFPMFQSSVSRQQRTDADIIIETIGQDIPEIKKYASIINTIINELHADNMIRISKLEQLYLPIDGIKKQTTSHGNAFLQFISQ